MSTWGNKITKVDGTQIYRDNSVFKVERVEATNNGRSWTRIKHKLQRIQII